MFLTSIGLHLRSSRDMESADRKQVLGPLESRTKVLSMKVLFLIEMIADITMLEK